MFIKNLIIVYLLFNVSLYGQDLKSSNQSNIKELKIDLYDFDYNSKTKECTLKKNGNNIELFDKRFTGSQPKITAYTCASWTKEPYGMCNIKDSKSISAVALSFGRYKNTNLLIGYKVDSSKVDAQIVVECSK